MPEREVQKSPLVSLMGRGDGFPCPQPFLVPMWDLHLHQREAGREGSVRKRKVASLPDGKGECLPARVVMQGELKGFAQSHGGLGARKGEDRATQAVMGRLAGTVDPYWKSCCPGQN